MVKNWTLLKKIKEVLYILKKCRKIELIENYCVNLGQTLLNKTISS